MLYKVQSFDTKVPYHEACLVKMKEEKRRKARKENSRADFETCSTPDCGGKIVKQEKL